MEWIQAVLSWEINGVFAVVWCGLWSWWNWRGADNLVRYIQKLNSEVDADYRKQVQEQQEQYEDLLKNQDLYKLKMWLDQNKKDEE